jgi:hypothetical protein
MQPFTLSAPALSLLLVFRTNASYGRWWEARKVSGFCQPSSTLNFWSRVGVAFGWCLVPAEELNSGELFCPLPVLTRKNNVNHILLVLYGRWSQTLSKTNFVI